MAAVNPVALPSLTGAAAYVYSQVSGDATATVSGTFTVNSINGAALTAHGVLIGEGRSAPPNSVVLGDAQILVGQTSADPQGKLVSGDATLADTGALTVTKTNGVAFRTFATQNYATPPAIGGTTPAAGAFTTLSASGTATFADGGSWGSTGISGAIFLTVNGGSITGAGIGSFALIEGTWNTTGVVDAALKVNVTNTASGAGSNLFDLQVGGASQFYVTKIGNVNISGSYEIAGTSVLSSTTLGSGVTASSLTTVGASLGVNESAPATGNVNISGAYQIAGASVLSSSTLGSGVTASSLTSVGTLTGGAAGAGFTVEGVTVTLGSDATGDIYYRNSAGVLTRLGIGAANKLLVVAGGLPSWANVPSPSLPDLGAGSALFLHAELGGL